MLVGGVCQFMAFVSPGGTLFVEWASGEADSFPCPLGPQGRPDDGFCTVVNMRQTAKPDGFTVEWELIEDYEGENLRPRDWL